MVQLVKIDEIVIEAGRQRKAIPENHLGELSASIESKGLFHPIVLRHESMVLVSGECRLRAIKLLTEMGQQYRHNGDVVPLGQVPVVYLEDLTDDDVFEAELDENLRRAGLTVQEEAEAVLRLHEMRQKQNPKHTISNTAEELRERDISADSNKVSDLLNIAKHLDVPEVRKAKSIREATKAVEKHKKAEFHKVLAETFDKQKSRHIIKHDDCLEILRQMPDRCVDVVCTDPPYGIDAQNFGSQAGAAHTYDDSLASWRVLMISFLAEVYRVCKKDSHLYIFCAYENFEQLRDLAKAENFNAWPTPLIWSKGNGMLPKPEYGPRNTYECILFLTKGDRKVVQMGAPDVIHIQGVQNPRRGAEKPPELFRDLLARSVLPGNHVADFFAGTGPILAAANALRCIATAVERDPEAFGILTTRVEEEIQ